jgi:hypothetical protein
MKRIPKGMKKQEPGPASLGCGTLLLCTNSEIKYEK